MPQIRIKLRDAMEAHADRTGRRVTYADLAKETGLSVATLQSIGTRSTYNATLDSVAKLCGALDCGPAELLELVADSEQDT